MAWLKRLLAHLGATYGYTPRQARELLVLLAFCGGVLLLPWAYKQWLLSRPILAVTLPAPFRPDSAERGSLYLPSPTVEPSPNPVALAPFNPNAATQAQWQSYGAPEWLARRIGKYLAKGGSFKDAADVGRVYDFPPTLLARLTPYFRFAPATKRPYLYSGSNAGAYTKKEYDNAAIKGPAYAQQDLNTTDSAALEALPGVGPATARRIIQYRKLLGGYVRTEQLYELYHQDSARTATFLPYIKTYPGEGLTLLNLNTLARQGRLRHPYLSYTHVKLIAAWVRQHGTIARASVLLEHNLLDSATYSKVLPYLQF